MALGLSLSLISPSANQALRDAAFVESLTNSAGQTITFFNGQPVRLARPVGATLLRNSRGQVIVSSSGSAVYST